MSDAVLDNLAGSRERGAEVIRRRHIIYVSGYDPRGAQGYFDLFRRTFERSQRLWPISLSLKPLEIDSEDFAHWHLDIRGPDWHTTTHYDFLRMERFIRSDMAGSTGLQILRILAWLVDDVVSGTQFRIFRAAWRFGLHLLCFQLLLLAWIAVAATAASIVGHTVGHYLGLPLWAALASSLLAMILVLFALRPLADRWRLVQIGNSWTNSRRFGRGRPTWYDTAVDAAAQRLLAVVRSNEVDEVAVVGHSSGCVVASAVMAHAMELDPDLGKNGPRLVLLTLGSVMPAVALHPAAQRMRDMVSRLAAAHWLTWVDCQSRKDVMCFANFDPVSGVGAGAGSKRTNPLLWQISFRDLIAPQNYNRFRSNFFRVHYQYIMGADRRAPYDYTLLVGGPAAISQWPEQARDLAAALANDERR